MIDEKRSETLLLERTLQRLFGETSYHVEKTPCRGKFRGHNDYSIVFGSGRKLFIGQDQRNYLNDLRKQIGLIQHFRDHQAENTEKIKAVLAAHDTPFCDVAVDISPYPGTNDLVVYGVVVLTHQSGTKLMYRETNMHYFLVSGDRDWHPFDECMAHLLKDACGERAYCKEAATPERRPSSMKPYKTITLRLDAAHYARLTETARTAGLKIEPMLRQLIMGVNLRPRPPDTYAALLRELNAIGNNVNQLAYQANARGAATQDEIREAARLVRQAVRLVRDTL